MNILFRVDSSINIGSGHLMRCLTLAMAMKEQGYNISFVCRSLPGDRIHFLIQSGFDVRVLADKGSFDFNQLSDHEPFENQKQLIDAEQTMVQINYLKHVNLIVVDHYGLNEIWEQKIGQSCGKLMVIDDLANRNHDCDFLLDQNFYIELENRYTNFVSKECVLMLGPKYALLRPEFLVLRQKIKPHNGIVKHIFVFMGSGDPTNETGKVLKALKKMDFHGLVDVVVSSANSHKNEIERVCDITENFAFHQNVDNMAQLMAQSDFAIGAAGATTWERCCLGLPSMVLSMAENQVEIAKGASELGLIAYLGESRDINELDVQLALIDLLGNQKRLIDMQQKSMKYVDGHGVEKILQKVK